VPSVSTSPIEITVALFSLGGVVIGAFIAGAFQWWTSRQVIAAERERLHEQMHGEAALRREEQWRTELRLALAELLGATDPEGNVVVARDRVTRHTHAVYLLLDGRIPQQKRLRGAVNNLSAAVTGIDGSPFGSDAREILGLQSEVYSAARAILNPPTPAQSPVRLDETSSPR
jgi:hypothetical protein